MIAARYLIETPLDPARVAAIMAGEQSSSKRCADRQRFRFMLNVQAAFGQRLFEIAQLGLQARDHVMP